MHNIRWLFNVGKILFKSSKGEWDGDFHYMLKRSISGELVEFRACMLCKV